MRILGLIASLAIVVSLVGCDYFGMHEGYEEGDTPMWAVEGSADFAVVGISPSTADVGDEVTVYMASEDVAQTNQFNIDSFWFCTFDGESAMLETGGNDYDPDVDSDDVVDELGEVDLTEEELEDLTISSASFDIPEGTITGEGLVITPNSEMEYFYLTIQ